MVKHMMTYLFYFYQQILIAHINCNILFMSHTQIEYDDMHCSFYNWEGYLHPLA